MNKYYSYNIGKLPVGCQYCVRGQKLVVFVTGVCPRKCYFCPVSDHKYQKDVVYANERKVTSVKDLLLEAHNMRACGAGITGGDPLVKLNRTILFIKTLKKEFKHFHIHLYTSLNLVNGKVMKKLFEAGLDEIRFHPDIDDETFWGNIDYALAFSWDIGIEIPLIPGKFNETVKLIDYFQDKVKFINLNELEVADNEHSELLKMGFQVNELSYAVQGSLDMGLRLMKYVKDRGYSITVHLCTAKLKDRVQLSNRIKREGKTIAESFDIVDHEGLLTRGVLYLDSLKPGFGYEETLKKIDKTGIIRKLESICTDIIKKLRIKAIVDKDKPRILLSRKNVKQYKKEFLQLGLVPAIVKQYPTADQLEIEVEFLNS